MPGPLSEDLRWPAVRAVLEGNETQRQIAQLLVMRQASLEQRVRLDGQAGGGLPRPIPGDPAKVDAAGFVEFKMVPGRMPDAIHAELADDLDRRIGVRVSVATIGRMVQRAGWTLQGWAVVASERMTDRIHARQARFAHSTERRLS